jgi:hypothetical protein
MCVGREVVSRVLRLIAPVVGYGVGQAGLQSVSFNAVDAKDRYIFKRG